MSAIRWATAQNGNWGVAANWSPMTVPGISDDVTIDAFGTYTISIAPYAFVHTLDLNDTGATLALAGGADLVVAGDATFRRRSNHWLSGYLAFGRKYHR